MLEEARNSFATSKLELLDMGDLFSRVQALRTGTGTVEYGMAAVELELIIYSLQPFLCIFISTITYPPAAACTIPHENLKNFLITNNHAIYF